MGPIGVVFAGWPDTGQWQFGQYDPVCGMCPPVSKRPSSKDIRLRSSSVSYSPDGQTLASGSLNNTIRMWDVSTGQQKALLEGHTENVKSVSFSPDGETLASGSSDETIRMWDVSTGQQKAVLEGHTDFVHSVSYSPDGQTLASGSCGQYGSFVGCDHRSAKGRLRRT